MSCFKSSSRRNFLKGAGYLGAFSAVASTALQGQKEPPPATGLNRAKNLIFLVADGMGTGTLSLANHWNLRNKKRALHWMDLYNHPDWYSCLQGTASASSPVTDSAAAGSAWGSGQRVNNGSINYSAEGGSFEPIFVSAKKAGKATGLVSTCRITHATPAAFVANEPNRNNEDAIADQYLKREMDIYLGGGLRHFENETRNLVKAFTDKGYAFCRGASEMDALPKDVKRILGLFSKGHMPYAIDRLNDPSLSDVPGLDQMFRRALQVLSLHSEGFVLQIEAGRVDHAGHANDPAAIVHEQLEFDRCIPIALEYCQQDPETLVIVTTDHGTGGCQLNGLGDGYGDSGPALERINRFKASFEAMEKVFAERKGFDPVYFEAVTGISPDTGSSHRIASALQSKEQYFPGIMADVFQQDLFDATGVGWTSHNHTGEPVEFLAAGPGADKLPSYFENFRLYGYLMQALGLG